MAGVAIKDPETDEEVDSLTMRDAIGLCRKHNIQLERGKTDLYLLKYNIKLELLSRERSHDQLADFLKQKQLIEKKRKHGLSEIYTQTLRFSQTITAMNDTVIEDINKMFPDVCKTLEQNQERVLDEVAPVLILGETGSGKSTFINLLLNDNILPCSLLSNTHVICEIRHISYKRRRRVSSRALEIAIGETGWEHYSTPDGPVDIEGSETYPKYRAELELYNGEVREIHMTSDEDKETFKVEFAESVQMIEHGTGRSLYRVVRLYVPCPLLQSGMMIVDSPGVGESQAMEDVVMNYVTNAAAFIYVIDSTNAGGVQERVSRLLSNVYKKTITEVQDSAENAYFRPQVALFICNKWDEVESADRAAVLKDTRKRIQQAWTGCEDNQVITFSSVEAQFIQERGGVAPSFGTVLDKIQELIPEAYEMVIAKGHGFLDQYLSRCITTFETHLKYVSLSIDERKKKRENTKDRFKQLNDKINTFFKDQKETLKGNIDKLAQDLKNYLSKDSVTQMICSFSDFEIPDEKVEWSRAAVQIRIKVYERFRRAIKAWEDTQNILGKTVDDLKNGMKKTFPALEEEIVCLEKEMTGKTTEKKPLDISYQEKDEDSTEIVPQFIRKRFVGRSVKAKIVIGFGLAPLILAGVVVRLPYVGFIQLERIITKHKMEKEFKSALQHNGTSKLKHVCEMYARKILSDITDKMSLKTIIEEDLQFLFKSIDVQQAKMENQIKTDLELLKKLKHEQRADEEIQKVYEPQKEKFQILVLQLKHFMVLNNPSWFRGVEVVEEVEPSDIVVCSGIMADIVEGRNDSGNKVWVRRPKEEDDYHEVDNCIRILQEYSSGKKSCKLAQCAGIWSPGFGENVLYQVLEPLQSSLRVFLRSPGQDFLNNRHNNYQVMMKHIAEGLAYLHDKGLVHIDLSLDTIAVDSGGKTKLTNIARPRRLKIIAEIQDGKVQLDKYVHLTPRLFTSQRSILAEASESFMEMSMGPRKLPKKSCATKELASNTRQKLKYNARDDMYSVGIVMWEMWKEGISALGKDTELDISSLQTAPHVQAEKPKRSSLKHKSTGSKSDFEESEQDSRPTNEEVLQAIYSRLTNLVPDQDPCFEQGLNNDDLCCKHWIDTIKHCLRYDRCMGPKNLLEDMPSTYPEVTIHSSSVSQVNSYHMDDGEQLQL